MMEKNNQLLSGAEMHKRRAFVNLLERLEDDQTLLLAETARTSGREQFITFFPDMVSPAYPLPLDTRRREELLHVYETTIAKLANIDISLLLPPQRHLYESLSHTLPSILKLAEFPTYLRPLDHTTHSRPWSFLLDARQMGAMSFQTPEDYMRFASHMRQWPEWVETAMANMNEGITRHYVQAQSTIRKTWVQLSTLSHTKLHTAFMTPIKNMPEHFSVQTRQEFSKLYSDLIETCAIPGYGRLLDFMPEYASASRRDAEPGLYYLPDGVSEYRAMVEYYAGSEVNISQLHEEAKQRVDELLSCLRPYARKPKDFDERIQNWRQQKKKDAFRSTGEIAAYIDEYSTQIKTGMRDHFDFVPSTPLEIILLRDSLPFGFEAHYQISGSMADRKGKIILPSAYRGRYSPVDLAQTLRHEGLMGHHLLFAKQRSQLSELGYCFNYTAFDEGWALYAETLHAGDQSLIESADYMMARLLRELSIARGVVIDTGLHGLGWTWNYAVHYRQNHGGGADSLAVAEQDIRRFLARPGQCLTYYLGERHFLQSRELAERVLGAQFDEREFHDFLLAYGPMSLQLSEDRLANWLSSKVQSQDSAADPQRVDLAAH